MGCTHRSDLRGNGRRVNSERRRRLALQFTETVMDYSHQAETHGARFGRLHTRMLEHHNDLTNICWDNRNLLGQANLLTGLSEALRHQAHAMEGLAELMAAEQQSMADLLGRLKPLVMELHSDVEREHGR